MGCDVQRKLLDEITELRTELSGAGEYIFAAKRALGAHTHSGQNLAEAIRELVARVDEVAEGAKAVDEKSGLTDDEIDTLEKVHRFLCRAQVVPGTRHLHPNIRACLRDLISRIGGDVDE